VPKPHTPFQWAGQADRETIDRRLRLLRERVRDDRRYGRAIGVRYSDGGPGVVEGLLARGDRRLGPVIEAAYRAGARFDGWSEHFDLGRWLDAAASGLAGTGVDLAWYTTRRREWGEVLPWDHLDLGLDKDWLWEDWQAALAEEATDDCRVHGCYDCGVCTSLGTWTEVGPTGRHLAPPATDPGRA